MKKYFKFVLLLGISLIFLTGCVGDLVVPESDLNSADNGNDSTSGNQEDELGTEKGTLKIYLTDALEKNVAYDTYDAIEISISRIEAHFVETDEETQDIKDISRSKKGNWQVIADWSEGEGYDVDLIELKGKSILLASEQLLPGKYTQLRVFLKDQAFIFVNGEKHVLDIPSVGQTGIKLNHPFEITPGYITELTLDFDAQKSIIKTGNGKYKLKPVIGIISNSYSQDELYLGSIAGQVYELVTVDTDEIVGVEEGIMGALVKIEGVTLLFEKTDTTDENGDYTITGIPFGDYEITATASALGYTEVSKPYKIDTEEVITVDFELKLKESENE